MEVNNTSYGCVLDNISNEGALIRFSETDAPEIQLGAVGKLKVILLNDMEYPCKVVRVNYPRVGLSFL
ncbi:MAG TPA: PilZ domain-containing protein [Desulfuromonadales bacterium]|nr:PilZ domain-containing protein [Desulfuromonadales bacterium]